MTPDTSNPSLDALVDRLIRWDISDDDKALCADAITALRAQISEARMQIISDGCQLQEAHDRALAAEAERDAAVAGAVRVKPLAFAEWENAGSIYPDGTIRVVRALSGLPAYFIHLDPTTALHRAVYRESFVGEWGTYEGAVSAAQADYAARILSALEPDPDALTAVKSEARGDALKEAVGYVCRALDALTSGPFDTSDPRIDALAEYADAILSLTKDTGQ